MIYHENVKITMGHVKITLDHVKITLGHVKITLGHVKITFMIITHVHDTHAYTNYHLSSHSPNT